MKTRWRPSPVSSAMTAVIGLVRVGDRFFLQHRADQRERALLENETTDASVAVSGLFGETVVEESGGGLDQIVMNHVFEPFFTTRRSGTGLGLAMVQHPVQAHHGEITLENVDTAGVRATVVLPVIVQGVPA